MRVMSIAKIALLAAAVALPTSVFAAKVTAPPSSCAYGKGFIPTATFCSYNCDDNTKWCSQQGCFNGVTTPAVPCYGTFCTAKCGG
jgi:hypothetical protein